MNGTANDPSFPSQAVKDMQARAAVCNTLMGGTLAMREAGVKYLPQEPAETPEGYAARKAKTVLFPAFKKAISTMVGKPFGQEITIGDDVPQAIEDCLENVDLGGRDFDTFARDAFGQTIVDGIGWIIADYPRVPPGATLADERAMEARPYLIHVPLANVLGWRCVVVNGKHKVQQFRYKECMEEPDGAFGTKMVDRVRVWEMMDGGVSVSVYLQDEKSKDWILDPALSGPVSKMDEIPVVTLYTGRKGFMCAEPPLEDLAWLNVEHWQSRSDQRHILHVARVPLLFGKNLNKSADGKLVLGADHLTEGGTDSDLKYVEHTGAAIGAGREDLIDIEAKMQRVAGEVLARQGGMKTATENDRESTEGESQLRLWLMTFEDALEEALRLMAVWIGEKDGGEIDIAMDWDEDDLAADLMLALNTLQTSGNMSKETLIWNLQRRNGLPPGVEVEDEMNKIAMEGPVGLGSMLPTNRMPPKTDSQMMQDAEKPGEMPPKMPADQMPPGE